MTRSMTGFGRAVGQLAGELFTVEVTGVNHRFLECSFRLPGAWLPLEGLLRDTVKEQVSRGKLTVSVRRDRNAGNGARIIFDAEVAKAYIEACRELGRMMSTTEALSLNTLARLDGVFSEVDEDCNLEAALEALKTALREALGHFNAARAKEGEALAAELAGRMRLLREALEIISAQAPEVNRAWEERLRARVRDLAADTALKEDRLALEVALLAEKSDVTEELVRLKTHFDHVDTLLASSEPVGRELNFASQEIQREINTLGSKLREVSVSREVLRMKSELEKFREQVQNIE